MHGPVILNNQPLLYVLRRCARIALGASARGARAAAIVGRALKERVDQDGSV